MLRHIKKWSFDKKLQERRAVRKNGNASSGQDSYKVGILYESTSPEDMQIIQELKLDLKSKGMIVKTLAYIDDKIETSHLVQKAFSKKEVKWDGIPEGPLIDDFLSWEYDYLICPVADMKSSLAYLISLTDAHLKIGCITKNAEDLYDIIIDGCQDKQLSNILAEIFQHLKIISN